MTSVSPRRPTAWQLVAVGEAGVLVCGPDDAASAEQVADCYRALMSPVAATTRPAEVLDVVPAAATVLVQHRPGPAAATLTRAWVGQQLARAGDGSPPEPVAAGATLELPVSYDGDDLAEVGRITGLGADGVVAAHTRTAWTVAFTGFAPGFGYLVPAASGAAVPALVRGPVPPSDAVTALLAVPRRAEPRVRVPAGAVALAGGYSGVYPRSGPGGWQLLGRTTATVWDVDRDPPALLVPGRVVRFVAVPA